MKSIETSTFWYGTAIQMTDSTGRNWYVRSVGRNGYKWTRDYTYARIWKNPATAVSHMTKIFRSGLLAERQ